MENSPYFLASLKEDLARRQSKNTQYSLRAYARDFGLNQAALSIKGAERVMAKLNLNPRVIQFYPVTRRHQ